jgi:hypothetical protein
VALSEPTALLVCVLDAVLLTVARGELVALTLPLAELVALAVALADAESVICRRRASFAASVVGADTVPWWASKIRRGTQRSCMKNGGGAGRVGDVPTHPFFRVGGVFKAAQTAV